jgi:hypothetical protein
MPGRFIAIINALKNDADRLRLFLVVTAGYAVFNVANHYLTESLYQETGAHLIHVPSGVRMVIVLVAGVLGAAAISLASFPYAYWILFDGNLPLSIIISITSSLIPLTTFFVVRRIIHWQNNFADLTPRKLLIISITYATTNATVHQFIYHLFDVVERPVNAWLVMFTGDILGIVIILYLLRLAGKIKKDRKQV